MKHSLKVTLILISMFFIAQLIGLFIINAYSPTTEQVLDENGNVINVTSYNLPYGLEPPQDLSPKASLISIIISIIIAVSVMFFLMKFGAERFLRMWFFLVIILALAITFNALFMKLNYAWLIALCLALPLAYFKVFRRNILIHNGTELLIYPGIASIFVPLLNIWTIILLLIFISLYDIYAVWHAGFMQKMAKYQIKTLRVFSGFYVPYMGKKERELIANARKSKSNSKALTQKIKVNIAILGGGDVVFPIILAGVVFRALGLIPALIVTIGATLALSYLFYISKKGKFYPAMPFITAGCFIALGVVYLLRIAYFI